LKSAGLIRAVLIPEPSSARAVYAAALSPQRALRALVFQALFAAIRALLHLCARRKGKAFSSRKSASWLPHTSAAESCELAVVTKAPRQPTSGCTLALFPVLHYARALGCERQKTCCKPRDRRGTRAVDVGQHGPDGAKLKKKQGSVSTAGGWQALR